MPEPSADSLRITEIFFSLQGETQTVGIPTVFIRLTGCPLRCHYCDTAYAFQGGTLYTINDLLAAVQHYRTRYVTVTGGEPLAQKNCLLLLKRLCDEGYRVSLETSGALDIAKVDARVVKVVDIKTPESGESEKNRWENLACLLPHDEVKFVVCSQADYLWSKGIIEKYDLLNQCTVLFSPSYTQLPPRQLADWIIHDQLAVRMQVQLHKFLWGDERGR